VLPELGYFRKANGASSGKTERRKLGWVRTRRASSGTCHKIAYFTHVAHFDDQLGDSFCPTVVSCRGSEPSARIVQIWRVPVRVDSKTMCRPSGASTDAHCAPRRA